MQSHFRFPRRTLIWAVVLWVSSVGLVTPTLAANDEQPTETNSNCPADQVPYQGICVRLPSLQEVELDRDYCESSQESARICCNDPLRCLTGQDGPSIGAINAVGSLALAAVAISHQNAAGQGLVATCNLMKKVALGGAIANAALGTKCLSDKSSCEERCQAVSEKYERVLRDCDGLSLQARTTRQTPSLCTSQFRQAYLSALATARGRGERCTSYNLNIAQMGASAVQSVAASQLASLCESTAMAETQVPAIDTKPFNSDCLDPANVANPICFRCRGPQAATDPLCRGIDSASARRPSATDFHKAVSDGRRVDGSDLVVPTNDTQKQNPQFDSRPISPASAHEIPNNGGGFAMAANNAGSSGSPTYVNQEDPGYPTEVLHGVGSMGGFVPPGGSNSLTHSAGFSGFGGLPHPSLATARLKLQRFLPGTLTNQRHPAGLKDLTSRELGQRHDDIFQRISQRVRFLCRTKRLICD